MSERFLNKAVTALVGNDAYYDTNGTEITNWRSPEGKQPTTEALNAKMKEIEAEYDAQAYARNRIADYPDFGAQLNKIYDDGLTKWKSEMVDPVKAKWPKDNSGPK